jgi:uncharacterized protein
MTPLDSAAKEQNKEVGMRDIGSGIKLAVQGNAQLMVWLLLALGLCALPMVAGSQNMQMASAGQTNMWLKRYDRAMNDYRFGKYDAAYAGFRDLADYGSAGAQTMLGHLYWAGKGVEQSHGKAVMWFHRAAERGYAPAQLALGRAYAQGRGTRQDRVRGAMWVSLAATRGTSNVQSQASQEFQALTKDFTPEQLNDVAVRARSWRPDVALMP